MEAAWAQTVEVDSLKVLVIVDNQTDMLSPACDCCRTKPVACTYSSEITRGIANVKAGRAPFLDFSTSLLAGHGLSLLLTVQPPGGGPPSTLLFDAGPQRQLWRTNAERLGIPVGDIEAVVLSHWHMDHSAALPEVAAMIVEARCASTPGTGGMLPPPPAVFDVHPRRPHQRGIMMPDGKPVPFNPDPQLAELEVSGATVVERHSEAHTLCGGCFYVSGAIPRVTSYESGNPSNASQFEGGGPWKLDPELEDERFLVVRVRGRGAVVFSACSHAGIVNVMRAAQEAAGGAAPYAVIGGFHLATSDCLDRIGPTVADIAALSPAVVVAGHCTGWRTQTALQAALPGRCMPCSVGSTYEFSAPAIDVDG